MRAGIDWGGTKIELAVLDDNGEIIWRNRAPTPRDDYEGCISLVKSFVERAEAETGPFKSVGVGIPGAISPITELVKNANSTWLNGQPLRDDLSLCLNRQVFIANDANCLAVSEAIDGAGAQANIVFGVILGTGVGGGIVIDKKAIVGAGAIAGEWGHNPMPLANESPNSPRRCWCGRDDCIETYLSGPAWENEYHRLSGERLKTAEIYKRMGQGDRQATESFDLYLSRLGASLASVVNIIDPDIIVLGGGLSNIDALYDRLPAEISRHVFTDRFNTPVAPATYGDSSGVRGAAWLYRT